MKRLTPLPCLNSQYEATAMQHISLAQLEDWKQAEISSLTRSKG